MDAGSLLVAAGATALLCAACTGLGAVALSAARVLPRLTRLEAASWSFALGLGVAGWAVFFLAAVGMLDRAVLALLAAAASGGLVLLRRAATGPSAGRRGGVWWLLLLALLALLAVDLMEALAPPADADSLAYHFALPEQFLATGRLEFVPRAVDGAIPLLVHMTYLVALALGGETALTLWTALSGWMVGLLAYTAARHHLGRDWSLAVALLALSAPAVLYGGGTGQVEVRLALFATIAALAVARAVGTRALGWVAVAGLAAGFFIGAKYTGLLFAAAASLPLLLYWRAPRVLALYAATAMIAGFQWYGWNWWHSGDPIFPTLHNLLGLADSGVWTAAQDAVFRATYFGSENPLPRTPWWLLAYPFLATLFPPDTIESGRTGLGPYGLLILPFVLAGLWRWRGSIRHHPLGAVALIVLAFYVGWFFSGVSQRVRHLLPVWPLFLICTTAIAVRWVRTAPALHRPLAAAAGLSIALHLAGQATFGLSYARHLLSGESRADFLARTVSAYGLIAPTEAAMQPGDRVLVNQRQLIYLFTRPVFYYHSVDQVQVVTRNAAREPARFLRELRSQQITLLLVPWPVGTHQSPSDLARGAAALVDIGCAAPVRSMTARTIGSRTLQSGGEGPMPATLYRLKESGCRL